MDAKERKSLILFAVSAVLVLALVAFYTMQQRKDTGGVRIENLNGVLTGDFTGTATGFGGDVIVNIRVEHGEIISCSVIGDGESPDVGGKYLSQFETQIVKNQGQVDAVTGATVTSNAVKAALQEAMTSASLASGGSYTMAPGTYVGRAHGFSAIDYVTVSVTVSDKELKDVKLIDTFVDEQDSYENRYMCQGAFERLGPQIMEYQSVGLDAVTGATGSSNGIKSAVRDALKQAFQANGLSEEEADSAVNAMFSGNKPEKKTDVVELHYDVVVVGAGASGTIASLTALDEGASVLNIEKTFRWGGQSMLTGGPKSTTKKPLRQKHRLFWMSITARSTSIDLVRRIKSGTIQTIGQLTPMNILR